MKPLALALSVVCLVFVAAACGGSDGAKSAGPVPSVSVEAEPPALAAGSAVPATSARVGFVGLPPVGATPSTPETGELVLSFFGNSPTVGGKLSRVWVYADGRLIWARDGDLPEGANPVWTGYLEQRLTPEGVELLRSEIISSGLFDHDLALGLGKEVSPPSVQDLGLALIRVRNAGRLVSVGIDPVSHSDIATPEQVSALERVDALLNDPWSWLPASAWADREIRAYVPSEYAVEFWWRPVTMGSSRALSLLPAVVQDLLRTKDRQQHFPEDSGGVRVDSFSELTTEEARAAAEALEDAGFAGEPGDYGVGYSREEDTQRLEEYTHLILAFEPIMPHGEWNCSACH